jgi:hypothetical protein
MGDFGVDRRGVPALLASSLKKEPTPRRIKTIPEIIKGVERTSTQLCPSKV